MNEIAGKSAHAESWASGQRYQPFMGRWSLLVAAEFIRWLEVPPGKRWLDVGCGTGSLSRTILEHASPAAVRGIDPSDGYIAFARDSIKDGRMTFGVGAVESSQLPDDSYDVVVSGLVLNFMPDPAGSLSAMMRLTRKRGTIAAYVWDYAGKMELLRYFWDAAEALDQGAQPLDEGRRFPLCTAESLRKLFDAAGLQFVEVCPIEVPTRFESFDDYWLPFLGGQGPAATYLMSLTEERRNALRNRLRSDLPVDPDGSIRLSARAWAVRATTP